MEKKIKLSIGLIVKDEEEVLERCLLSIQPLLNQLPSELIITDTGSADNTVEIAKRYTDKVYFYKWCNDFSKARNFVLDKAQGEWFLQIDADEYFKDTRKLLEFLLSSESLSYNNVGFIIRNYFDAANDTFQDAYICRLFRIFPGRRYVGSIHEGIPLIEQTKYLDEYLYHSGYIKEICSAKRKYSRNLPLLLNEVKRCPTDMRTVYHLAQEYFSENELDKAEIYYKKSLELKTYRDYNVYAAKAYSSLSRIYTVNKCYLKVIHIAADYFKQKSLKGPTELEILDNAFFAYYQMGDYQRAIEYFERLSHTFEKYKLKAENKEEGILAYLSKYDDEYMEIKRYQYINSIIKCKNYQKAMKELHNITFASGIQILEFISPLWIKVLTETEDYSCITVYYEKCQRIGKKQGNAVRRMYLMFWQLNPEVALKAAEYLTRKTEDEFTNVQRLLCDDIKNEKIIKEDLFTLLDVIPTEIEFEKVLFLAIKYQVKIDGFLKRCSLKKIQEFAAKIYESDKEIRQLIIDNLIVYDYSSLSETYFFAKLKEEILKEKSLSYDLLKKLFSGYINDMMIYIEKVFTSEIQQEGLREIMPDDCCFILYALDGQEYLTHNKPKEYFEYMRKAVRSDYSMHNVVKRLTEGVEKELSLEAEEKEKFNEYAKKVKSIIKDLIIKGDYQNAGEALLIYENINPKDDEIQELKKKIGIISGYYNL